MEKLRAPGCLDVPGWTGKATGVTGLCVRGAHTHSLSGGERQQQPGLFAGAPPRSSLRSPRFSRGPCRVGFTRRKALDPSGAATRGWAGVQTLPDFAPELLAAAGRHTRAHTGPGAPMRHGGRAQARPPPARPERTCARRPASARTRRGAQRRVVLLARGPKLKCDPPAGGQAALGGERDPSQPSPHDGPGDPSPARIPRALRSFLQTLADVHPRAPESPPAPRLPFPAPLPPARVP